MKTMNVQSDSELDGYLRELIETAADKLESEGRTDDEDAVREASARLVYVLTMASVQTETSEPTLDFLYAFPEQATYLSASSLREFLEGICPIWPFCT